MSACLQITKRCSLACAIALLPSFAGAAMAQQATPSDKAERILREIVAEDELPSISVAISSHGSIVDVISEIVPHRARGYSRIDAGGLKNAVIFDPSDRYPAGGLLSTPRDLVKFADALLAGRILGEESRRLMWKSAELASGEETGHGMGWDLSPDGSEVYHGGTTVGTTTFLYIRPRHRVAVAIAVNLSRWPGDRQQLAATLAALFQR